MDAEAGTLIDYRLRLFGVRLRWQVRITDWEPPVGFVASDLHDALWATFVVQVLPAGPQHCHPRARVPRAEVLGGVTAGAAVLSCGV